MYEQVQIFLKELAKPITFVHSWARLKFCMYLKRIYFNYSKKKFFTRKCKTIKLGEFIYQFSDEDKFIDENEHRLLPLCTDARLEYHNKHKIRILLLKFFSAHGKINNLPKNLLESLQ
jgi:hypothetical protein